MGESVTLLGGDSPAGSRYRLVPSQKILTGYLGSYVGFYLGMCGWTPLWESGEDKLDDRSS